MHAIFCAYGKTNWLEYFLNQISAQKVPLKLWRINPETGQREERTEWTEIQLRTLPGGFYEVVFPQEHMDTVLTTLEFNRKGGKGKPLGQDSSIENYELDKEISILGMKFKPLDYIKKFLRIEDPPEFKTDNQFIWFHPFVSIIPLGIRREQGDVMEKVGPNAGWWHEGI